MLTSARMMSGLLCFAFCSAALPSSTMVRATSSRANVMLIACWMVLESSARSRLFGTLSRLQGHAAGGKFQRDGRASPSPGRCTGAVAEYGDVLLVVEVVASAVIHSTHSTHPAHASH